VYINNASYLKTDTFAIKVNYKSVTHHSVWRLRLCVFFFFKKNKNKKKKKKKKKDEGTIQNLW